MVKKRCLTNDELKAIRIEEDMLQGNINRMCVTSNSDELKSSYAHSIIRIKSIYDVCLNRFKDTESEESEEKNL